MITGEPLPSSRYRVLIPSAVIYFSTISFPFADLLLRYRPACQISPSDRFDPDKRIPNLSLAALLWALLSLRPLGTDHALGGAAAGRRRFRAGRGVLRGAWH